MHDQRIVILGGTSGIGLAIAQRAAREGARVVVVSSTRTRVDAALAQLPGAEGDAVDLADAAAVAALFGRLGPFDHLAYTAGSPLTLAPLASLDLAAARGFFELRYWAALAAVRHAVPRLRPGGSITLTGGTAALRPGAGWSLGASLCGAMEALTRALAVELAPVRVNIVVPGLVDTELWSAMPAEARDTLFRTAAAALPVRRIGRPDDIAGAYLMFMASGYATGQRLVVDGGGVLV